MSNFYIWTEIFNCGKIGQVAISSFLKHHKGARLHVYGFEDDFNALKHCDMVIPIIIKKSFLDKLFSKLPNRFVEIINNYRMSYYSLKDGFQEGHLGTARLWAHIIKKRPEKYLIHFDSDVIFLGDVISDLQNKCLEYDLVGPIRNYKNNPNGTEYFEQFDNLSSTYCFAFNREIIGVSSYKRLVGLCIGRYELHPVLDFFDPIMFIIKANGGKHCVLNFDDVGGCDYWGERNNVFKEINNFRTPFKIDFGHKLIHFSAVGSGMNIYYNKNVKISEKYSNYAIDRYALFCRIFYNESIGVDLSKYKLLIDFFEKNSIALKALN